jgi:hypothetical protein
MSAMFHIFLHLCSEYISCLVQVSKHAVSTASSRSKDAVPYLRGTHYAIPGLQQESWRTSLLHQRYHIFIGKSIRGE